mmetsp:Transcript_5135/g.7816  ORF Transcript_5135/g.7816 Transcript_5135/m.7816 type:complete len:254 (+) Transcript_5135:273-1034(+)
MLGRFDSSLPFSVHHFLDVGNRLSRVQVLRARVAAVHDRMASVQLEGVVQLLQALLGELVPAVLDPAVGLHQHCRAQVLVGAPPVGGAGGGAARAQDALVHAVQLLAVFPRLQVFHVGVLLFVLPLEPWLDGLVLVVEVGHVWHQVAMHVHVWERVDAGGVLGVGDPAQARQGVGPLDVHGTGPTDAFATRLAECKGRVLLSFNLDQGVQNHRPALLQVNGVGGHIGLATVVGVPSVDLEVLDVFALGCRSFS